MNGKNNRAVFPTNSSQAPLPENFIFEQVDPAAEDDDSDSDTYNHAHSNPRVLHQTGPTGLKPGKKTKGRVKIKMEFIENKLRRYTTFSKRKTGIMKKAYELSTLTGTQVMLLVASETGHVYTFATRKLQPIITSESGKELIQACLYSPDPPPGQVQTSNGLEQRMNPSGFEETDLSCALGEEEQAAGTAPAGPNSPTEQPQRVVPCGAFANTTSDGSLSTQQELAPAQRMVTVADRSLTLEARTKLSPAPLSNNSSSDKKDAAEESLTHNKLLTLTHDMLQTIKSSVAESSCQSATNPSGNVGKVSANNTASSDPSGNTTSNTVTSIAPGAGGIIQLPMIYSQGFQPQATSQPVAQPIAVNQVAQPTNGQGVMKASLSQVVSALHSQHAAASGSQTNPSGELNTPLPAGTPSAINIMQGMTPGIVMYHTPQGIVYATPTQNLQDRTIFNFQQPATAISMTQADQSSGQQIITIPVPVSLGGAPLLQLAPPPSVESSSGESNKGTQPPAKKSRK